MQRFDVLNYGFIWDSCERGSGGWSVVAARKDLARDEYGVLRLPARLVFSFACGLLVSPKEVEFRESAALDVKELFCMDSFLLSRK
jgi:hypothetical protein